MQRIFSSFPAFTQSIASTKNYLTKNLHFRVTEIAIKTLLGCVVLGCGLYLFRSYQINKNQINKAPSHVFLTFLNGTPQECLKVIEEQKHNKAILRTKFLTDAPLVGPKNILHLVCGRKDSHLFSEVIEQLVDLDPELCKLKDSNGKYPLDLYQEQDITIGNTSEKLKQHTPSV